jgi:hypothetical protein
MRPWSPLNEVARRLQTGRTIEDPMTASCGLRWFEADPTGDGNAQRAVIRERRTECHRPRSVRTSCVAFYPMWSRQSTLTGIE